MLARISIKFVKILVIFLLTNSVKNVAVKIPIGAAKKIAPNVAKKDAIIKCKIPNLFVEGFHSLLKIKLKKPISKIAGIPQVKT